MVESFKRMKAQQAAKEEKAAAVSVEAAKVVHKTTQDVIEESIYNVKVAEASAPASP